MELTREIPLENGLTVSFYHRSNRYFGDYHRLIVEIVCEVPLKEEYFANLAEFEEALTLLGETALFRRDVNLMGIPTADVEKSLEKVMDDFAHHSLSYLSSPSFPRKLVHAELVGARRKGRKDYTG